MASLAARFAYNKPDPVVKRSQSLSKKDFLTICKWKSERRRALPEKNSAEDIEIVSKAAFSANDPQVQILLLTSLEGVRLPTASALLHWGNREAPIIDFRAWWTVFEEDKRAFQGPDWVRFSQRMWTEADFYQMNIRELDKAVWQYSLENQPV